MTTIARNRTKKIDEIFGDATRCITRTLDNGFSGEECPPKCARNALFTYAHAKLQEIGNGVFHVSVHSNRWYELTSPIGVA